MEQVPLHKGSFSIYIQQIEKILGKKKRKNHPWFFDYFLKSCQNRLIKIYEGPSEQIQAEIKQTCKDILGFCLLWLLQLAQIQQIRVKSVGQQSKILVVLQHKSQIIISLSIKEIIEISYQDTSPVLNDDTFFRSMEKKQNNLCILKRFEFSNFQKSLFAQIKRSRTRVEKQVNIIWKVDKQQYQDKEQKFYQINYYQIWENSQCVKRSMEKKFVSQKFYELKQGQEISKLQKQGSKNTEGKSKFGAQKKKQDQEQQVNVESETSPSTSQFQDYFQMKS